MHQKIKYRSMKKYNEDSFKLEMSMAPFHVGEVFENDDSIIWFQHKLMEDVIDVHAPNKSTSIKRNNIHHMNSQLRKAGHKKNQLILDIPNS